MFRPVAPTIQTHLRDGLAAIQPSVPAAIGYPVGGVADEQLWLPGEWEERTVRAVSGWGGRDVAGQLEVRVVVTRTSDVWTDVRDRALEIAAELEDLILADPTLAGIATNCWVAASKAIEAHPEERKIQCALSVTVSYEATVAAV
jgi:hypothetical protein